MTVDIVIFGAGGLARELAAWMAGDPSVRVRAFATDRQDEIGDLHGVPVLDRTQVELLIGIPRYVMGLSDPAAKRRLAGELAARGWEPITWVHPSAIVATEKLGQGVTICPHCTVSPDAVLGDFVLLNVGCSVGHDAIVGAHTSLLGRVSVNGSVMIGESVLVGAGAVIVPKRSVGDFATVGIGSVVVSNVPPRASVFGNPARRLQA